MESRNVWTHASESGVFCRGTNSQASGFRGDEGSRREVAAVAREHLCDHVALFSRRLANDANNSRVWYAADDSQLAEVLVQRHQDTTFRMGTRQDLGVAGV
jgi:hypothetical protein